uniref:Glycosyltransferase family 92 protein n=2 Tax=Caenorhabditis tropicalis TaxID=1561998 RepID=A0A1I7TW27_9PELO
MEMQSGKPIEIAEIVVWAKNETSSFLVSTPYIRVTPHDFCEMVTVFATVQLLPNVKNILLVSDDGSTEIPFVLPSYQKKDLVVCLSPLYVTEQWQNFLFAVHVYKRFGGFLNVYLISCISSLFALMKKYESAGYLKIQEWYRVNFPYVLPKYVDPFVGMEFQNQAAAHSDCLLQYKESARYITFIDLDDILIPRSAPSYVEEFQKIISNKKRIAYVVFRQQNYEVNVAKHGSKFSFDSMMKSLRHQKSSETRGKLVADPRFINFTWIYPTPTFLNGMSYIESSDNAFIHLKTIKWVS